MQNPLVDMEEEDENPPELISTDSLDDTSEIEVSKDQPDEHEFPRIPITIITGMLIISLDPYIVHHISDGII